MFFIPGFLISIITFPGVIVHELAHQIFCMLCKCEVFEVCYFRVGNPAGYVVHEAPKKLGHQFLISMGPFFLNTFLGAVISAPAAVPIIKFGSSTGIHNYLLIWLGVSIAMHSFPSTQDAKLIWEKLKEQGTPIGYKLILAPVIGLVYIVSLGSVVWLDFFYGMAVAMLIPNLITFIFS